VSLVIAGVIAVASWFGAGRLGATAAGVERTHEILRRLDLVVEDLTALESGQRAFIVTGLNEFLEPYERARVQLPRHLQELVARLDPPQMAAGIRLEELVRRRMEAAASVIEARRTEGFAAAADQMAHGEGPAVVEQIRDIVGNIRGVELALLSEHTARAHRSAQLGLVAVLASTAMIVALSIRATRLLLRSIRAEKQVRELIDGASDAFFLADLDGRYVDVNPSASRLLGYAREELIGKSIADFVRAEDRPRLEEDKAYLLRPGASRTNEWSLRRRDGSFVSVEISSKILEGGRWQAFVRDISDRKRAEAERERLLEAEQRHARAREEWVAVVSHDLKTPLSAITLREEFLGRATSDPALRDHVTAVRRAVATMERSIRGLLDSASLQAGRLRLDLAEHDFGALVREVVDVFQPIAASREVAIESILAPMPLVRCDRERLTHVLYNLVGNALKFTPRHGLVTLHAEWSVDEVRMEVSDTGVGIPPEALAHIFDPYYTTEPANRGTGLGLYIAKGIVEAHGGSIDVSSERNHGSTFWFVLPQHRVARQPVTEVTRHHEGHPS
jgi:PAS domain S-box-containing protein